MRTERSITNQILRRGAIGALTLTLLLAAGISVARSAEIVPSVGLTRAVEGDNDARIFGSLAFKF
jgi:hypothetical protein